MSPQPDAKRGDELEALHSALLILAKADQGGYAATLLIGEVRAVRAALRGSEGESTREPVGCCARCGVACQFCGASEGTVARYAGDEMTAIRAKLAARMLERTATPRGRPTGDGE